MILLYIFGGLLALLLLYFLFLGICCLFVSPDKEYGKNSPFYRSLLDCTIAIILWILRIHVHVTGKEKVPEDQKVLFVCNHRSNFDPIVTLRVFRKQKIAFISKPENFKIPLAGKLIRRCCFLAIDRENPRNAISTINKAAKLLARQEVSIGVYPEGTRSKTCELLPFHNGVFKIAKKSDASIAVLSITGTEQISKRTPFRRTEVYLDVLEVIPASQVRELKTDQIGSYVRSLIENNTEKRENPCQKVM